MNKKFWFLGLCGVIFCTAAGAVDGTLPGHDGKEFEMVMLMDAPRFMGPRRPGMGPSPMDHMTWSDTQRQALKKLGKKHRDEMESLYEARDALRDKYLERFEDILTDEQFRKIENMRKDLRREMKKLNDRERKLFERHRGEFENILTDDQKNKIKQMRMGGDRTPDVSADSSKSPEK